jgi:RimJ/RimL family protein N-acetyltransferase
MTAGHVLRPYQPDDIPRLCALADDAAVADRLTGLFPHPYDLRAALRWVSRQRELAPPRNLVIAGPDGLCGGVGIERSLVPDYAHDAELGYWLGRRYWGRGLATAAVAAFLPWAAEVHGLARLTARVFADNPASRRVLEKCGFAREGVLRRAARKHGRELDVLIYGILLDG